MVKKSFLIDQAKYQLISPEKKKSVDAGCFPHRNKVRNKDIFSFFDAGFYLRYGREWRASPHIYNTMDIQNFRCIKYTLICRNNMSCNGQTTFGSNNLSRVYNNNNFKGHGVQQSLSCVAFCERGQCAA